MRALASLLFLTMLLCPVASFGHAQGPSVPKAELQIPKGWERSSPTRFTLKDFETAFRHWQKELDSGHQPWRMEPANAAAACLLDFGIQDSSDVLYLAQRLVVVQPGKQYRITLAATTYIISIKVKHRIPIAYKLSVQK